MRFAITLVLGLSLAGAAHAQFQPIKPIKPLAPIGSQRPSPEFKPFEPAKPYTPPKPFKGTDTNTAPSGLYPELHKPKRPTSSGF
jgi:hypothetical protein